MANSHTLKWFCVPNQIKKSQLKKNQFRKNQLKKNLAPYIKVICLSQICLGLSGCLSIDITPVETSAEQKCNFVKHSVSTNQSEWDGEIVEALASNPYTDMLFLSGGSQNGAFGAGFLQGWATNNPENSGHLPDFAVVTGVSTGSLLSIAAFTDNPKAATDAFTIESEGEVIDKFVGNSNGKLSLMDYIKAIKAGGVADLAPMRLKLKQVLLDEYTPIGPNAAPTTIMAEIASRGRDNKKLYTIVTNVDSGDAEAFDMTAMAIKVVDANDVNTSNRLTNCFVSALVASSVVPIAARPEFIDNTMYIDGGARFGIMNEMIGAKIKTTGLDYEKAVKQRSVYGIINGDQKISDKCDICDLDTQTIHKDWNIIDLATRSIGVLTDQVYQFSETKLRVDNTYKSIISKSCQEIRQAEDQGYSPGSEMTKICADFANAFPDFNQSSLQIFKIDDDLDSYVWSNKTCADWKQFDKDTSHPLQFHPNFMKCMMAYGDNRAKDVFTKTNRNFAKTANLPLTTGAGKTMSDEDPMEFFQAYK